MRIVYWARIPLARKLITDGLTARPDVELTVAESLDDFLAALPGASALVLADAPEAEARQVADAIARGGTVRWMHFVTAGKEGFDAAGLPEGVVVTGPSLGVSPTVAEHALTLILALLRRVPDMLASTREARWDRSVMQRLATLEGETVAIVGFGNVGREIAARLRPFGAEIVGVRRSGTADPLADRIVTPDRLHEILPGAGVVVLAMPQTAETEHLFGAAEFAAMRSDAILVNVARGGVVDQTALVEALQAGTIGGAALDVTTPEPLPGDDPLWRCPNVLISSHIAGGGSERSRARIAGDVTTHLDRLIAEGTLRA
ncbi:phosphoglycerate dehydrogenase-like enzyme [Amorphus suaedae]